ncbi:hypothetical protein [Candidatus Cyanaurora vandensis]|uniref:hypothetical protein n=1 Tax=Candidatus Cyanaurora vandensis TaxID=2714958 RepID=UPI00257B9D0C|nr:hypothetical protein [Candidatus Cyanaurora vandensis]
MSQIIVYESASFVLEQYSDGIAVLLRDGQPAVITDHLDELDLELQDTILRLTPDPDWPVVEIETPVGHVRPAQLVGTDTPCTWVLRVLAQGRTTLLDLEGDILYPEVLWCRRPAHDIPILPPLLYPTHAPKYVHDALHHMTFRPLVMGYAAPRHRKLHRYFT